jgi:hypothetical protein
MSARGHRRAGGAAPRIAAVRSSVEASDIAVMDVRTSTADEACSGVWPLLRRARRLVSSRWLSVVAWVQEPVLGKRRGWRTGS